MRKKTSLKKICAVFAVDKASLIVVDAAGFAQRRIKNSQGKNLELLDMRMYLEPRGSKKALCLIRAIEKKKKERNKEKKKKEIKQYKRKKYQENTFFWAKKKKKTEPSHGGNKEVMCLIYDLCHHSILSAWLRGTGKY